MIPTIKREESFHQENPKDQIKALIGAVRGSLSNAQDGIVVQKSIKNALTRLDEIEKIILLYPDLNWDNEPDFK